MGDKGSSPASYGKTEARKVELVGVDQLVVGDRISQVGCARGPWYLVLRIDQESVTIDGRARGDEQALPVTVGYGTGSCVLRALG